MTALRLSFAVLVLCTSFFVTGQALAGACPEINCGSDDKIVGSPKTNIAPREDVPDLSLQIKGCLSNADKSFVFDNIRHGLVFALQSLDLSRNNPPANPDIRMRCIDGVETLGAWSRRLPVTQESARRHPKTLADVLRESALEDIDLLKEEGDHFGLHATSEGILELLAVAWADLPKSFNTAGQKDPKGPIYLHNLGVSYFDSVNGDPSAKQILTNVHGYYAGPFTNTGFDVKLIDSILFQDGEITCSSGTDVSFDPTPESILATIFGLINDPESKLPSLLSDGPGCRLAALLPVETMTPFGFKILYSYNKLIVDATGLTATAWTDLEQRSPSAKIVGPSPLKYELGSKPIEGVYEVVTDDLRPPLSVRASSKFAKLQIDRGPTLQDPTRWKIRVRYAEPLGNKTDTLTVTVMDADHLQVKTSRTITTKGLTNVSLPPVCDQKPYLPQCQP